VKVLNWVEDQAGTELAQTGKAMFGTGGEFRGATTYDVAYREDGKVGEDLMQLTEDAGEGATKNSGVGKEMLMKHGDMSKPPVTAYATMYQLVHGK
jgi:hypothetical protein